jgi:hypothetical protein
LAGLRSEEAMMQEKYPEDAVVAAFNTVGLDEAYVEQVLVEREGVSEKVSELAERTGVKLATNMLVALAQIRAQADRQPEPGEWYGLQAANLTSALLAMMLLRGVYIGMLLERGAQAVDALPTP